MSLQNSETGRRAGAARPPLPGSTKRAIVDRLKRADALTASDLAATLEITEAAVRQHLDALADQGFVVSHVRPPIGRGRPATEWRLSAFAIDLFPDRHADLSVHLIAAIRTALGEEGLEAVIASRTAEQRVEYERHIDQAEGVDVRVQALADVRTAEGYMAEVVEPDDGDGVLLVEHHCPICEAASACQGLCRDELALFRGVLGDDVTVERTQHLLSGDSRCIYRITPGP